MRTLPTATLQIFCDIILNSQAIAGTILDIDDTDTPKH